jgi:hypothetical protein
MKIFELFEGATESENFKFNQFLIDYTSADEKILWYPSSGNDFRDVINFSSLVNRNIEANDLPNLFIHNDYDSRSFDKITSSSVNNSTIFCDDNTTINIEEKIVLRFNLQAKGNYTVRERYVDFYEYKLNIPHIYLLRLSINTTKFGNIKANLLYVSFENINLFEFFMSNSIKIDFMVKVREGCGFGGNRMSVTQVYYLLSRIGLKYLINDTEIHWCEEVIEHLIGLSVKVPKPYTLNQIGSFENWSGFNVFINKVEYSNAVNTNHTIETIRANFNPNVYSGID